MKNTCQSRNLKDAFLTVIIFLWNSCHLRIEWNKTRSNKLNIVPDNVISMLILTAVTIFHLGPGVILMDCYLNNLLT